MRLHTAISDRRDSVASRNAAQLIGNPLLCRTLICAAVSPRRRACPRLDRDGFSAYTEDDGEPAIQERYYFRWRGGECRTRFPGRSIGRVECRYHKQGVDYQQIMDFRKRLAMVLWRLVRTINL